MNIEDLKSYLKDSPVCLDLEYYIIPKIKQINYFLDIFGSSLHFLKWCSIFFSEKRTHNTFQIRGEKTQRQQDSLKTKLNLSIFVWNGSCCPIQNHILKKQNAMKLKFTHFPVIKNTIKRIAFKNAYESSIIFQSFLYASIPAKSTSYVPIFFP